MFYNNTASLSYSDSERRTNNNSLIYNVPVASSTDSEAHAHAPGQIGRIACTQCTDATYCYRCRK